VKYWPTSLATREMQIKSALRFYFTLDIINTFRKARNIDKYVENNSYSPLWEYKLVQSLWKTVRRFFKY
jgi:hypothetical protein